MQARGDRGRAGACKWGCIIGEFACGGDGHADRGRQLHIVADDADDQRLRRVTLTPLRHGYHACSRPAGVNLLAPESLDDA